MSQQQKGRIYEFGRYRLDAKERVLLRDGAPVPLALKAFETLLVLVKSHGHILEKGELMRQVWPDSFVEENNLAQNISLLRRVLGDGGDGGSFIETVARRGYRFTADVKDLGDTGESRIIIERVRSSIIVEEETDEADAVRENQHQEVVEPSKAENEKELLHAVSTTAPALSPSQSHSFIALVKRRTVALTLAAALLVTAAVAYSVKFRHNAHARQTMTSRTLAILPFRNLKPDARTDFLGFSLADSIITRLGNVRTLIVRPSSYVEKYRNQEVDPKLAARELEVDTLLVGSFLVDGDDLRINAQLIDVSDNEILWRDTIDVKYERLLTVEDRVAQQVIKGLQLNLSPEETARLRLDPPQNPLAYEDFLRGRYLISTNDHKTAIKMLEESVSLDPNYALAWAYLGKAYSVTASQYFGGREFNEKARAAYDHALALNPEQPEARILLANFLTENNRVEEAVPILRGVIEANPNHPMAHWELSYAYRYAGMLEDSIVEGERALQLYPNLTGQLFNSYLYVGQPEKFIKSIPQRDDAYTDFYRGLGYYYTGDETRAAVFFERANQLDSAPIISQIGMAFRLKIAGKERDGLELLRAAERKIEAGGASDGEINYKLAQAYAVLNDMASALRLLRRSVSQGFFCYPYFASDPLLKNLRAENEFNAILEQARQRHEDFKRKFF